MVGYLKVWSRSLSVSNRVFLFVMQEVKIALGL